VRLCYSIFTSIDDTSAVLMMDLEFISYSDPNEVKSKDSRRRVRSHAMQHVRRRQRLGQRSESYPALQPNSNPENIHHIPRRSITWHNPEPAKDDDAAGLDTNYEDISGANRMEQLEVYPVSPNERYIYTVFHHCELL
jgi:hypothetical protein